MNKILVAYFSCTGVTEKVAKEIAKAVGGDIYEIEPEVAYTKQDLDWTDSRSRSSVEMKDASSRPKIKGRVDNMESYETVFIGFPIWWYVAPHIINTFLESYDFKGKKVIPFATSGGSSMGKTKEALASSCPAAKVLDGKVLNSRASESDIADWAKAFV